MTKEFGRLDPKALLKEAEEERQWRDLLAAAKPPPAMSDAPVAPARASMQLLPDFEMDSAGWQRQVGSHWAACEGIARMNAQAQLMWQRRHPGADLTGYTAPFRHEQVEVAHLYRSLVEWRDGSAIKCASVEGRGGGGEGLGLGYSEAFLGAGRTLAALRAAVGRGHALQPRRHMDRTNARRAIPDLALLDAVVLHDMDLSAVLKRYGWLEQKGGYRNDLRSALRTSLDRMRRVATL